MNLGDFEWDRANDLFYRYFTDGSSVCVFKQPDLWDAEYFPTVCAERPLYVFRSGSSDGALAGLAVILEAGGIDPQ